MFKWKRVVGWFGLITLVGTSFWGCQKNASSEYAKCVQLDIKGEVGAAWDACTAAISADPTSDSGKAAAEKLAGMKSKYDLWKAEHDALQSDDKKEEKPQAVPKPKPQKSIITSEEDVKKYAPGVWVAKMNFEGFGYWIKQVIKKDGTGEFYITRATDNNWGIPSPLNWAAQSGKYSDTGQRWYGLAITGVKFPESAFHEFGARGYLMDDLLKLSVVDFVVVMEDSTSYSPRSPSFEGTYKRGDIFPFSK